MNKLKYNTTDLENMALKAVNDNKLFFIEDIIPFMPCSRSLFYERNLDKMDSIKEALVKNKVELKIAMRAKWYKSTAPALQLALMKLISTDEERRSLSTSFHETKQEHVKPDLSGVSTEELLQLLKDSNEDTD
jgi:hypothetical protein